MNVIQAFVPSGIVQTFAAFLDFCYITRRNVITEDSLKELESALHQFHEARQIFAGTVRTDGPSAFSLPRQHAMVHYPDHIKNFGSPNGLCSSITESKHITVVKRPWCRSNRHMALPQMLKSNQRLDKLAAARVDFATRGMLADSCFVQAIKEAAMDREDDAGSDTDDTDADSSSDTSNEMWSFDTNRAGVQDLGTIDSNLDDSTTRSPDTNNLEMDTLDDGDTHGSSANGDAYNSSTDDGHPHTPCLPSLILPVNEDDIDDDCGPVESGPIMNEVRLIGRKG